MSGLSETEADRHECLLQLVHAVERVLERADVKELVQGAAGTGAMLPDAACAARVPQVAGKVAGVVFDEKLQSS